MKLEQNTDVLFYDWLKNYQPLNECDFDAEYASIYDTFSEIFGAVDGWEGDFETILRLNGEELGIWLLDQITAEDREKLITDFEWDESWQGLFNYSLGEVSVGINSGGPASRTFITMFKEPTHKSALLGFFVASLIYNLRNNIEMYDIQEWNGIALKDASASSW